MAPETRAKRARTGLADPPPASPGSSPLHSDWGWASLTSGPAGLIAERLLSSDVSGYVRFRAVCAAWRASCADPRAQGVADRRFHPRRWLMLPRAYSRRGRRRFLNVSTGECVHARIPDLRSNYFLGTTAEGFIVLCRKDDHVVQLLNPLTGQLTDFPCAATMLDTLWVDLRLKFFITVHSAGLADDSTVALLYNSSDLAVAKPGDERWTLFPVDLMCRSIMPSVLLYAGRLYCVNHKSISVVETTAANQQPRLAPVADHRLAGWMYPVYDDEGGLILVHRNTARGDRSPERYTTYQAKLDTGAVVPVRGLGGRALFLSRGRSVSVSAKISSSISTDTVYACDYVLRATGCSTRIAGERNAHHYTLPLVAGSSSSSSDDGRDWANGLSAGPAGLIAERVLSDDVAGYVRFRAVCAAWRASCADPRAHDVFDRRFHPRRWTMIPPRSSSSVHSRRAFVNASTGECIHVRLPDLRRGHYLFGPTAEGLVVLCRKDTLAVQLHNPLTGQRASLPRATSLLFPTSASKAYRINGDFRVRNAGLAGGSAVALHYGNSAVAVARPGDECWTQLGPVDNFKSAVSFAGRFYCVTFESISVLEAAASQPPRLVVAVDLKPHCGGYLWSDMVHLVDKDGELVLVHCVLNPTSTNFCGRYTAYRVNLDKGDMGGHTQVWVNRAARLVHGNRSLNLDACHGRFSIRCRWHCVRVL
ncbi:hypothetical protein C2845_PM03G10760 [Panicum miliaceum]|uniref:KIB1-4 beta-propeller domain-containing protein n=1 Tax=Panicum miliaceum TaxID=4540 RepID=A0A3L6TCY3_PANMI|nr:hypothetical protein C2845_PM03G10760 [Panicum miliaceum]